MDSGRPVELPLFDKLADDRSLRTAPVRKKVGVFLLEGWLVGCRTDADPQKADPGLRRSVAEALKDYRPVFGRLDALWAFEPPTDMEQIILQRLEQEESLKQPAGSSHQAAMTPDQVRRFVRYFYEDAWQPGITSPGPPEESITFRALTDARHQFTQIIR